MHREAPSQDHDWGEPLSGGDQCGCLAPLNSVTALALSLAGAWVLCSMEERPAGSTLRGDRVLQGAFGLALVFSGLASFADHCFSTELTNAADHVSLWALLACAAALQLSVSGFLSPRDAKLALGATLTLVCVGQLLFSRAMDRLLYLAIPLGAFCLGALLWYSSRNGDPATRRYALLVAAGAALTAALQNPASLGIHTPVEHWYLNTHAWFHVTAAVTLLLFLKTCQALDLDGSRTGKGGAAPSAHAP